MIKLLTLPQRYCHKDIVTKILSQQKYQNDINEAQQMYEFYKLKTKLKTRLIVKFACVVLKALFDCFV